MNFTGHELTAHRDCRLASSAAFIPVSSEGFIELLLTYPFSGLHVVNTLTLQFQVNDGDLTSRNTGRTKICRAG